MPVAGIASRSRGPADRGLRCGRRPARASSCRTAASRPRPTGWFEIDGVRTGYRTPPGADAAPRRSRSAEPPLPADRPHRAALPFAGLRVLDLGVIVVGAELGRLFADYGADVIKIESTAFPDGSRQSWDGSEITDRASPRATATSAASA